MEVGLLDVEDPRERRGLLRARDDVHDLPDARHLSGRRALARDRDARRVLQVLLGDRGDARRHRRGEERGLLLARRLLEDRFEVLREAHVEHLVGLVEHEEPHRVELQGLAPDVVERAPGRADDDVDPAFQRADLWIHRRAAVDCRDVDAEDLPVAVDRLGDLHRELARRHEDERGRPPASARVLSDPLEQRQRERGGLARARRGLPEHVASGEERRDRGVLDRRRLLVAERAERAHELFRQPEGGERVRAVLVVRFGSRHGCLSRSKSRSGRS